MNHEPECGACLHCGEPCMCAELRAAYRRGREDAAKAVLNKLLPEPTPNEWDAGFNVAIYEAIAAARGDGEQA